MKKIKTKAILLSIMWLCLLGVMKVQAQAATVYTEGDLHYVVEDNAIAITEYFGFQSEVTVPSAIAGYPVDTIRKGAFANASTVEKVNLPDTIMTVEQGAMKDGQTVIYKSNTDEPIPSGEQESNTENTTNPTITPAANDKDKAEDSSIQSSAGVEEAEADLSKDNKELTITDGAGNKNSDDSNSDLKATSPQDKVTVLDDQNTHVVTPSGKEDNTVNNIDKVKVGIAAGMIAVILMILGVWFYHKKSKR